MVRARTRFIENPERFVDLSGRQSAAILTRRLQRLTDEINLDRTIDSLPAPKNVTAASKPSAVLIQWDPLSQSLRGSVEGARLWRAAQATDSRTEFDLNNAKQIIASLHRSTWFLDQVGDSGATYIYWVQWIDLNGKESDAGGGVAQKADWDSAAPGALVDLSVTGANGNFNATWKNPATNVISLDNFAQQYSTTSNFTTSGGNELVTWLIGKINQHSGFAPNKTYWFRYAAHNQSGSTASNTDSALTALLPNGWGLWTNAPGNPISSGNVPDPQDTVVPDAPTLASVGNAGATSQAIQVTKPGAAAGWVNVKKIVMEISTSSTFVTITSTFTHNGQVVDATVFTFTARDAATYYARARATNSVGESANSGTYTFSTLDGITLGNHVAASSAVHGTTGAVMGANMANTMGASGQIDAKANNAKVKVRFAGSAARGNPPTSAPTMDDGEIVYEKNTSDASAMYKWYKDGVTSFWWKQGGSV